MNWNLSPVFSSCDVFHPDTLHNELVHVFPPALWHRATLCWMHFAELDSRTIFFNSSPSKCSFPPLCQSVSCFFSFVHHSAVSGRTPVSLAQFVLLISFFSIHHHHWLGFSSQWERFSGRPIWFPPTDTHARSFWTNPCAKMEKTQGLFPFGFLFIHLFLSNYQLAFVSRAEVTLMNNLVMLKETNREGRKWERMR